MLSLMLVQCWLAVCHAGPHITHLVICIYHVYIDMCVIFTFSSGELKMLFSVFRSDDDSEMFSHDDGGKSRYG